MGKPVMIDLFAGCGGLSLGLEQAGFKPILVNEINQSAMNSYLVNRPEYEWLEEFRVGDIKDLVLNEGKLDDLLAGFRTIHGLKKSEIDLVVGGPPCQGYSGIGHRRSYSVEKRQLPSNHLYEDMVHVIYRLQPKIFLFENVRGLLSSRWTSEGSKGEIWEDVKRTFKAELSSKHDQHGYHIRHQLVFAKDYGVPQNRPRVLMVGIRKDLGIKPKAEEEDKAIEAGFLPGPTGEEPPDLVDLLGDLVDDEYEKNSTTTCYPSSPEEGVQKELRTSKDGNRVSGKGAPLTEHDYSRHRKETKRKFQYMLDNDGAVDKSMKTKKFAQKLLPPRWGEKGPSITVTSLPDDYVHFSQPRILTVREWARLQMFPDWYRFKGRRTTGGTRRAGNPRKGIFERDLPKYTQIGNAVAVKLAEAVGRHFRKLVG